MCTRLDSLTSGINREVSNDFLLTKSAGQGCTAGARGTSELLLGQDTYNIGNNKQSG
jgi:hypothetical protein